ncbi:MAG: 1-acyl-sn-glycerol-3-phosphate acyltransferase [Clostridia bacterium]|nr:1-acyl-sn-glycerol-3-phosphate acyltransferase [Clostridia bacterium]
MRLTFVILINFIPLLFYVPKMAYMAKHPEKYSLEARYAFAQKLISTLQKHGRIKTEAEGLENLPESGGYMMFANHQGQYDAIGVLSAHKKPCSMLIDERRYKIILMKQAIDMLEGQSIDKESTRSQMGALKAIAEAVKDGRPYLVFPEGIYYKGQGNNTNEFKRGCFLAAIKAKCPIVPVTLIDSYKVFEKNTLKPVSSKVVFHKPIPYEEYKDMKAQEIADKVRATIDAELAKYKD